MHSVHIQVPAALLEAAELDKKELSQEAARLLALELYRERKISLGRAAELCETPLPAFMDFAARHAVPPLQYSFDELEQERRSAERPGA